MKRLLIFLLAPLSTRSLSLLAFSFALGMLGACATQPPEKGATEVVEKWARAFAASDVDGIVALYAPDARFMGTGSKTIVTNPAGIRTYFEQALLTNRPRAATLTEQSVQVLTDGTVVVTGLDTVSGFRNGQKYNANGRVTFVVARRDAGWQIVHFHRSAMPN